MIDGMIAFSLYTMLVVGLAVMLTAAFRRLRREDQTIAPPEEDAAFDRRIAAIEADYGLPHDTRPSEVPARGQGAEQGGAKAGRVDPE